MHILNAHPLLTCFNFKNIFIRLVNLFIFERFVFTCIYECFAGMYVYVSYVYMHHVCICIMCVLSAYRGQKKTSDPLKLELKTAVSYRIAARSSVRATVLLTPGPQELTI